RLVEVLSPSSDRIEPRFPEMAESGGFQWQHLAYPAQVYWKTRIVRQLLVRVGHFPNPAVLPTLGMPPGSDPSRYRTVAQFAIGPDGAVGFRSTGSHQVLDMPSCPIVHPALDTLYQGVREWIRAEWGEAASDFAERFTLRVTANVPSGPDGSFGGSTQGNYGTYGTYGRIQSASRHLPAGLLAIETRPGGAFDAAGGPHAIGEALLEAVPGLVGVVILGFPGGRGRVIVGQDFV